MNRDRLNSEWKQFSGGVWKHWDRLTQGPQREFDFRRDQFTSRIQERYRISRLNANQLADSFMSRNRKWWDHSNR